MKIKIVCVLLNTLFGAFLGFVMHDKDATQNTLGQWIALGTMFGFVEGVFTAAFIVPFVDNSTKKQGPDKTPEQ